jgi:hypothetical protein
MHPFQQRVVDEQKELETKLRALVTFIEASPIYQGLPESERDLMLRQSVAMREYNSILKQRIEGFA